VVDFGGNFGRTICFVTRGRGGGSDEPQPGKTHPMATNSATSHFCIEYAIGVIRRL
jgi:hypothetical protein